MTKSLRTILPAAAGLAVLIAALPAASQQVIKMTAVAGHPPIFPWVKLADEFFIPEVDKRLAEAGGKIKIEWTKAWGGTAVKLGSESSAIRDNLAEVSFVSTIFEAPRFPLQNITYVTPFGTDNVKTVAKVIRKLQSDIPAMNDAWARNNAVFLGGAGLDAYHLFTKNPIGSLDDMKGRKINAPGPSANWVKDTGAIAVAGTLQTYYNDIQTGVTEGALTFMTGAFPAKLVEVAPHITKVNYGAQFGGALVINKRVFDSLPPYAKKIFIDVGLEYDERFANLLAGTTKALEQKMVEAGAKVRELSADERKKWAYAIPNVAKGWAKDLDSKGMPGTQVLNSYMAAMRAEGVVHARDWSKE